MQETAALAPPGAGAEPDAPRRAPRPTEQRVLLLNVLVVAVCALIYELLCGTLASYLLGDAVLQFSLVLGTYVFAMGVGAWLSRALEREAASRFVQTELALALVGGLSVPMLLGAVALELPLRPALYSLVFVIGALVGVELPLLVKILRSEANGRTFGDVVARALAYDYVGALGASLLFPLLLVPHLGLVKTAVVSGAVNALVALSATFVIRVRRPRMLRLVGAVILAVLALTFVRGEAWVAAVTD
jgi:spermidine synthase